ncbi:MAG TPA: hypothetical protein VFV37_11070 [Luteibaculaceae bacterium]|nr:hypothetical protein [Luteibaculaceae bacterium]
MNQAVDIMREIVESLNLKVKITSVTPSGPNFVWKVCNTQYLNTGAKFTLNGNPYRVISFVHNQSLTVSGPSIVPGDYSLAAPFFTHGKFEAVTNELARQKVTDWNPIVWMFELHRRNKPADVLSPFESEGDVRLFLMNTSNWKDFATEDHYNEVIRPLSNVAEAIYQKALRLIGVTDLDQFDTINHAKFTTGGNGIAVTGTKVLPDTQSGIEIFMSLPIKKKCYC